MATNPSEGKGREGMVRVVQRQSQDQFLSKLIPAWPTHGQ